MVRLSGKFSHRKKVVSKTGMAIPVSRKNQPESAFIFASKSHMLMLLETKWP